MPAKRYKVTLSPEERQALLALVSKGKAAAYKLTRARMLLHSDQGPEGPAWSDQRIAVALEVSPKTVERTRQTWVEVGLEAALRRKTRSRAGHVKFDGEAEAQLIALACSQPPEGRVRWTLHLLADKLVEMTHFDRISHETIRQHLKKMNLNRG